MNENRDDIILGEALPNKGTDASDLEGNQARIYNTAQHEESWKKAIKSSPKALGWCTCRKFDWFNMLLILPNRSVCIVHMYYVGVRWSCQLSTFHVHNLRLL